MPADETETERQQRLLPSRRVLPRHSIDPKQPDALLFDRLQVGSRYFVGTDLETVPAFYRFSRGQHEMVCLTDSDPTTHMHEMVSEGTFEFALVVHEPTFHIVHRALPHEEHWFAIDYSWHLMDEDERVPPPPPTAHERADIQFFLFDELTNVLVAKRKLTVSPAFTRELHQAIVDQAQRPFDREAYDAIVGWRDDYYSDDDLVAHARARSLGEGPSTVSVRARLPRGGLSGQ